MNSEVLEEEIKKILVRCLPELKDKELDLDQKQHQFESWDSFSHMEIVGKLEEQFSINLEISEVVELDSPRKIIEVVKSKLTA